MKNKTRKIISIVCAALIALSATACSNSSKKDDINPEVNKEMSQLYIRNFNGGVGTEWLLAARKRFEEANKNVSFEDGKTGVQIMIEQTKEVPKNISQLRAEMFFAENVNVYDFVSQGDILEITDIVTEPIGLNGETESIEDKLSPEYKNFFKTANGKYYALPHYRSTYAITYDRDLFNEKNLFFGADGEINQKSTGTLSKGPDGKPSTYDDGLPATYEDFYNLCSVMKRRGVNPLMWSGEYKFYTTLFLTALKADFEGEEARMFYTFEGTTKKLVDSISNSGVITYQPEQTITKGDGYKMYSTAGTYYALDFFYNIMKNEYYDVGALSEDTSHIDAQADFLLSNYESKMTPIGMLIEGSWWPHESSATFQMMESRYSNSSLDERNLALMPYPKATDAQIGQPQTALDTSRSAVFINANIKESKIDLAKSFLKFLHTDESLNEFLKYSNMTRGFNFDVETEGLNTFAKSVVNVIQNSNVVLPVDNSEFFYKNYSTFDIENMFGVHPVDAFKSNTTSIQLFNSARNKFTMQTWGALFN